MKIVNLLQVLLLVVFSACQQPKQEAKKLPEKPNIIFLFADDQCHSTIHALGNKEVITPNLDKLVRNGVTFTNAYNMGSWSGAVCLASRAMLNTGKPVWKANAGVRSVNKGEAQSWAQMMSAQGYETYMTGKWHVSFPAAKHFDHTKHIRGGMPKDNWNHAAMVKKFKNLKKGEDYRDFMPTGYNRPLSKDDHSWSPTDTLNGGYWEGGQHWSEVLRDDAIAFINQAKTSEKPFFMYLAFNAPHDPRQAPQEFQDMYDEESLSVPQNFQPLYPEAEAIGNGPSLRDAALAPFPRTKYATRVHLKEYYASITHMDAQIGKILKAVEESGKADNTYIIYSADHGLAVGDHGLFGKQNMYDHSMRPPFMIIGPGLQKGKKVDAEIYLQDAMATALDLAGSTQKDSVFFHSVLPLALGQQEKSNYSAIYGGYLDLQRMIREDGYKLILYPGIHQLKLFNIDADPLEMKNLADSPEQKQRIKQMFTALKTLQSEVGDKLNLDDYYKL
ncbi:sulfatase-like hydrolase/transferase [Saccharicrinis fermentans]|uniref:Arylsulfatase n=1 Tax=Saccharicrinis fermentans DSM 9555 = JCM 21142 TaxID=869213 RepID=W7XWI6_9BACT|nr:sulfatase-like hydrolase/transferase [Saccharicrinis fermentans]GAF02690.1 arylsulfatase [Saccharicrinis fermentans DSM 9555 = JCM 21142]